MFLSLSVSLLSDQGDECVEATPRGRRVSEGRRDRRRVDNSVGVFPCLLFSRSFFVVVVFFLPLLQLLLAPLCFSTNSSAAGRRRGRGERGRRRGRALAEEGARARGAPPAVAVAEAVARAVFAAVGGEDGKAAAQAPPPHASPLLPRRVFFLLAVQRAAEGPEASRGPRRSGRLGGGDGRGRAPASGGRQRGRGVRSRSRSAEELRGPRGGGRGRGQGAAARGGPPGAGWGIGSGRLEGGPLLGLPSPRRRRRRRPAGRAILEGRARASRSEARGPPRRRWRPEVPGAVRKEAPVGVAAVARGEPGSAELGLLPRRGVFFLLFRCC